MKVNLGAIFQMYIGDGCGWVRMLGRLVFNFKDFHKHPPLFSERNGYTKFYQLGKYRFFFGQNRASK